MNTKVHNFSTAFFELAVPAETLSQVVSQIISYGKPTRVRLGISFHPSDEYHKSMLSCVIVGNVLPKSPAAQAGLRASNIRHHKMGIQDWILAADRKRVKRPEDLMNVVNTKGEGDTLELLMYRFQTSWGRDTSTVEVVTVTLTGKTLTEMGRSSRKPPLLDSYYPFYL